MDPNIHHVERRDRRGRRIPAIFALALIVVIGAIWVGLVGFLGTNAAFGTVETLEEQYICDVEDMDLAFPDLGTLSEVYTADGVELGKLTERNSQPVPLDEMPELVIAALLSAEDKEFYNHEGISFRSIFRAAIENTGEGTGVQGGSTITQQVVKLNFLTTEQTLERKICEAVIAAELENRYTKDQILEFYANSVFFGANAYGVKAAAQEYFGRTLDELTVAEAAALFAPVRNPTFYHPRRFPENVIAARNRVINGMADNGYITRVDATAARAEPLGIIPHEDFEELAPQVMISVRQELLRNPEYGLGAGPEERKRAVFGCPAADTSCEGGGGLKIYVTVDYDLQEEANRILRAWFRPELEGPTGAIAMVDNRTGAVKVMASGLDFGTDIEAGQRPYDLATQGQRQPGSAFKPFTLAAALEYGSLDGDPITLGSYWDHSSPAEIDCGFPCSDGSNIWTVSNAGGSSPKGLRTLESATYNSTNTVYARVVNDVGAEQVVEMAERVGIESNKLKPFPSITLGAFGVSPLEMASAYSTFANYGVRTEHYLIERIEDAEGTTIYEHVPDQRRVLDEALSASIVSTLEKVVSNGTGPRANIGRPQAGKTGTATDYRDVWFSGFIPQYTTAVWVGYADAQIPMEDFTVWNDITGEEQFYRRAFGGTLAAPVWNQFMTFVTEGLPVQDFAEEPPGTERYRAVPLTQVPDLSGIPIAEATELVWSAGLVPAATEVASAEPAGTLLFQSPLPGTAVRQGTSVTLEVSNGLPPEQPLIGFNGLTTETLADALVAFADTTGIYLGWVVEERPVEDPAQWGLVVGTDPPQGSIVSNGQTITVYIGVQPAPVPEAAEQAGDDG
jgi:penicillin-binding protein 1A